MRSTAKGQENSLLTTLGSLISKNQGFRGEFYHQIEHHEGKMNEGHNKVLHFSINDLSWYFCTLNVDCWYSKDSNIAVNHVSEKLIRIIKFKISFQIFNLKVVARIVFVSLRAFKWYQNHENWPRRTISNVIQSCINH